MAKNCPTTPKKDLSFSTTSEVQTFVRAQLGQPGAKVGEKERCFQRQTYEGQFLDLEGRPVSMSTWQLPLNLMYRGVLNPVDYDGSFLAEIKNTYKTNEIGFFIGLSFMLTLSWSFLTYRRNAILEQRKRFLYQQYKRGKFLEDNLRLKSKSEIINEK